jgi:hypothetical protein
VGQIVERLRARSNEIFQASAPQSEVKESWWKAFWNPAWLKPAALALGAIVLVVVVSTQLRNGPPALRPPSGDQEVLRSNSISVIAPAGDLAQPPSEIEWQATPNATKYEVQLLEVDGAELWRAETVGTRIELPAAVLARIVPAKTLLCQVSAFDASGHRIAQSEAVRFRLLQRVYKP